MRMQYFGDSFDIVKKSILGWLDGFGPWAAHPMFTHPTSEAQANEFSRFLGIPLISTKELTHVSDRDHYFALNNKYRSLFLDPDTGIRLKPAKRASAIEYVFGDELLKIVSAHPDGLVLTFDKSFARGLEREQVRKKLMHFKVRGIYGFGYVSHASFIALGHSEDLLQQARAQLLAQSLLPARRIVRCDDA